MWISMNISRESCAKYVNDCGNSWNFNGYTVYIDEEQFVKSFG